ncbi:MAG: hypothetical protein U0Q16_14560 [Bryobacteraceae bacterium]
MATAAQAKANRENAQHSTGPRSAEGKSRSASNSLRHGLCAKHLIVLPGEQEHLDHLSAALRAELDPQTPLEEIFFDDILRARWNIFRCARAEEDLVLSGIDPLIEDGAHMAFTRIQSYLRANERAFHRALKELKAAQSDRRAKMEERTQSPAVAVPNPLPSEAETPCRAGFSQRGTSVPPLTPNAQVHI